MSTPTRWAGQSSRSLRTAPAVGGRTRAAAQAGKEPRSSPPLFWRRRRRCPQRQRHSPSNGFFCVSTLQMTIAKLEGKRTGQCLGARPAHSAAALTQSATAEKAPAVLEREDSKVSLVNCFQQANGLTAEHEDGRDVHQWAKPGQGAGRARPAREPREGAPRGGAAVSCIHP